VNETLATGRTEPIAVIHYKLATKFLRPFPTARKRYALPLKINYLIVIRKIFPLFFEPHNGHKEILWSNAKFNFYFRHPIG